MRSLRYTNLLCPGFLNTLLRNPYLAKDVLALENVQRKAFLFALRQKHWEMKYEDRLRKLK